MKQFIRLSKYVVNTSKLLSIDIEPSRYVLNFPHEFIRYNGTLYNHILISEKSNPQDYERIKQWIDNETW